MCCVQPVVKVICATVIVSAAMTLWSAQALGDEGPAKPSPTPIPTPAARGVTPEQYAQAQAIAQATSLSVRIDAERTLAAAERAIA